MTVPCLHLSKYTFTLCAAVIFSVSNAQAGQEPYSGDDTNLNQRKPILSHNRLAQTTTRGVFPRGVATPPTTAPPRPGGTGRLRTNPGRPPRRLTVPRDPGGGSGRFSIDRGRITSSSDKTTTKKPTASRCGSRPQRNTKAYRRWLSCRRGKKTIAQPTKRRLPPNAISTPEIPPVPIQRAIAMETDRDRRPDELVVLVGSRVLAETLAGNLNLQLLESRRSNLLDGELARLRIPDARTVPSVVAAVAGQANVRLVAPNHVYGLQGKSDTNNYSVKLIRYTEIRQPRTGHGVRIGIIDTALDRNHPELSGLSIKTFDAMDKTPVAQTGHGTAIAGLIGGRKVVAGLAPEASVFAARAFDGPKPDAVSSDAHTLIAALDWLDGNKVRLVNLSFAGPPNVLLRTALSAAHRKGMVLVAAAGNGGPKARPLYPGAYPSTVAVTATDENRKVYAQANRGDYVFLAAPGVDLLVPAGNSGYDVMSGTSFAAAIVTGLAALHLEKAGPGAANIEAALERSTRDLGPKGRDRIFGYGLIDAAQLIRR